MPVELNGTFAEIVTELLEERSLSQRHLCDAVGVDRAHMSRLLRRRHTATPTPRLLERIAGALDIHPDVFSEYREWRVIEAVRRDADLRERIHSVLHDGEASGC